MPRKTTIETRPSLRPDFKAPVSRGKLLEEAEELGARHPRPEAPRELNETEERLFAQTGVLADIAEAQKGRRRATSSFKTGAELGNALADAGRKIREQETEKNLGSVLGGRLKNLQALHQGGNEVSANLRRSKLADLKAENARAEGLRTEEIRTQIKDFGGMAKRENVVDVDFSDLGGEMPEEPASDEAEPARRVANRNVLRGAEAVGARDKQKYENLEMSKRSFERVQRVERDLIKIYKEKFDVSDERARMDVLVNFKLGWGITSWSRRLRESYKNYQNVLKQEEGKFELYQSTMTQERADEAVVKEKLKQEKFGQSEAGKARQARIKAEKEMEKSKAERYFKHTKTGKEIYKMTEPGPSETTKEEDEEWEEMKKAEKK